MYLHVLLTVLPFIAELFLQMTNCMSFDGPLISRSCLFDFIVFNVMYGDVRVAVVSVLILFLLRRRARA